MNEKHNWDRLVSELINLLEENPGGLTRDEICKRLLLPINRYGSSTFTKLKKKARLVLSVDDKNITFDRFDTIYLYKLVDNVVDEAKWEKYTIGYLISYSQTLQAVADSMVNATDKNSIEGQRRRLAARAVSRLIEDLRDL